MGEGPKWLGVDCGASRVRAAWFQESGAYLEPAGEVYQRWHARSQAFTPLELPIQRAQQGAPALSTAEKARGVMLIDATCAVLDEALQAAGKVGATVHVVQGGIAAYGLKDQSARGIVVARNGPRIPGFLDAVEAKLRAMGHPLLHLAGLFSDGLCASQAECSSPQGALCGPGSGYVLHAGTGLAEGLWLGARMHTLDARPGVWPKAFELQYRGWNLESLLALSTSGPKAGDADFRALRLDGLVWLLAQRSRSLWEHEHVALETIVLGQKLWQVLLSDLPQGTDLQAALARQLAPLRLAVPRLVASKLTEPAVLGAAALARQGAPIRANR